MISKILLVIKILVFLDNWFKIHFSKINFPTWASTALKGSSKIIISLYEYIALAKLSLAFYPPERLIPFSPISV